VDNVNFSPVSGATTLTYSPGVLTATTYYRQNQSSASGCGTLNTNEVNISINPNLPVGVSISTSSNPVCLGSEALFLAIPENGGSSPGYQWHVNSTNVPGATSNTYSYVPANQDEIICVLNSNALCAIGSPVSSDPLTITVNQNLPVSISIVASANPVGPGTMVSFTAIPVNGGISPSFQWKVNSINAGSNSEIFSYIPANGDTITCVLSAVNQNCMTGNPASSNILIMTVTGINSIITVNGIVTGTMCYNATQTINVAGNGTIFTVQPGGSATMIAGQNIIYFPGAKVEPGGYLHGKINPGGPFCGELLPSIATVVTDEDDLTATPDKHYFKVYPNPAIDILTLELTGVADVETFRVEIYSMWGERILDKVFTKGRKQKFSLASNPVGIYFIRMVMENKSETVRIIKQN
jgi:hypothetical protein